MDNVTDILFPRDCLACGNEGKYVCASCIKRVGLNRQLCIECEKPAIDGMTHIRCKRKWGLDGVISVWKFERVIRQALLKTKYKFAYKAAEEIIIYLSYFLRKKINALPQNAILIPIPLHRQRQKWRGFNQTEIMGELLAQEMNWVYWPKLLNRKIFRRPQTELKGKERKKNVRGVFSLNTNYKSVVKSRRSIVLFDDVLTTGSTLKEAGKVLKRGGAGLLWGLTVAK